MSSSSAAQTIASIAAGAALRTEVLEPLLTALGATQSTPLRVIAVIPADAVRSLLTTLVDENSQPLTLLDNAAVETFFADAIAATVPPLPQPAPSSLAIPATHPPAAPGINIRHNLVTSQVDDRVSAPLADKDHIDALAHHAHLYGAHLEPAEDEMPSSEQLAVIKSLLDAGSNPYCDFAIWGPNATRMQRKMKLHGSQILHDGQLGPIELTGPPDITTWRASWTVYQNTLLMLRAVDLGVLEAYSALIMRFHKLYGPSVWLNLYQADVRARLERLPKQRLTLLAKSQTSPFPTQFDPARPWNSAFVAVVQDVEWWNTTFKEPALMIRSGVYKVGSFVDGDAPIGSVPNTTTPNQFQHVPRQPPTKKRQPSAPPPPNPVGDKRRNSNPTGARNVHAVVNGYYTHNRSGRPICDNWQVGGCNNPSCDQAHVCNICLDNRHGSRHPKPCGAPPPTDGSAPRSVKAKGKGKGKGKAKKGY